LTQGEKGRVRDLAASKIGVSSGYLAMLEEVYRHTDKASDIITALDADRISVYAAYREIRHRLRPQISIPSLNIGGSSAGKTYLVRDVVARIPRHTCYVEPFGGFATVLLNKPLSKVEIYNDINKDVVNFLVCLRDYPIQLLSELYLIPWSRWLYEQWLSIFDTEARIPDPERAAKWFCINEETFSGMDTYRPSKGDWRVSMTRNYALTFRARFARLLLVSHRLLEVLIENKDYRDVLNQYDGEETFFYLDPPYFETKDAFGISWRLKDHEELRRRIADLKGKWLLTYNDCPAISCLYDGYHVERVIVPRYGGRVKGHPREYYAHLIITNYDPAKESMW